MIKNIETILARMTDFADTKDPFGSSHFPIYNTATFNLKKQSGDKIYEYSRCENPTREALEYIFTLAEKGAGSVCTNTGIAAIGLLFETVLRTGSQVLIEKSCYGGTFRLLKVHTDKYNVKTHFADFTNLDELENILQNTKIDLIVCESPTNPGIKIIDIQKVAALSKKYNSVFAVDNSLATFIAQCPIELGADFSFFSTTKFISGHGSVIAGAVVASTEEWFDKLKFYNIAEGRAQNPMDIYLTALGIPSLPVRFKAHQDNASAVVNHLLTKDYIKSVTFPGLESHKQYELAKKQMKLIPGVFIADFTKRELAEKFIRDTKLFGEKASFGSPDSRLEMPAKLSHSSFSEEELNDIGISSTTVRYAIGLENINDLIEDIDSAI